MRHTLKSFVPFFGFVAIVLLAWFALPMVSVMLIGGVITSGILGGFSGKVGPVVGGKWKDIDYMKSYVIPANPNSAGQQTQRTRFTVIQNYARQVLSTLIQPYWDPYYSDKSGYNAFMSELLLNTPVSNLLTSAVKIAKGTLSSQAILTAVYTTGDGNLAITWATDLVGNQLNTDVIKILVFDKSTGLLYFYDKQTERVDDTSSTEMPLGLTATNLEVFVFFAQGSGSSQIISDSVHRTASAT